MFIKASRRVENTIAKSGHAVVIGASMTGLLTSRILVEYFERVTIIERDCLPQKPEARRGVPQAHHSHALQTQGQRILEQLFPGIEAELTAAGAPNIEWSYNFYFLSSWGWGANSPSELITPSCSRTFLEWSVRQRLNSYSNLKFVTATQVKGLLTDESNSKITGVQIFSQEESQEQQLQADLVVDASGRNSLLPKWLEKIGHHPPTKTVVNCFGGYSTCWYEIPEGFQADWKGIFVPPKAPDDKRGGFLYPVEGNRWAATAIGVSKDYPPIDRDGFMEFLRSLRTPLIYEAIKDAKPLSPVYGYRHIENSWYHYEKLSKLPEGLIAIGDAVCALNPFYGQGMTVSALSTLTLDKCLREQFQRSPHNLTDLTKRFQSQLAKLVTNPWLMATSEDSRWETTVGRQTDLFTKLMQEYMNRILILSVKDAKIHKRFVEVVQMVKTPQSLFAPNILAKVLMHSFDLSIVPNQAKYNVSDSGELQKKPSPTLPKLGTGAR